MRFELAKLLLVKLSTLTSAMGSRLTFPPSPREPLDFLPYLVFYYPLLKGSSLDTKGVIVPDDLKGSLPSSSKLKKEQLPSSATIATLL